MKKILAVFLILAFSQIFMAQTEDEYKKLFQDKIEFDKSGSSISAAFVDEKGTRFVSYGKLSKDAASANANENTIYEIGSITKVFTGVLLADAVSRGEVKLDDPISKFLPKTVKTPKFNGKEITLLDLATHSSGLPRLPDNLAPKDILNPYADYTPQKLYDFLSKYEPPREIGSQYDYSNLGAGLLGHVLSLRAKMSFEQLLTKRILEPLKMNDTSFALPAAKKSKHAQGFDEKNETAPNWFFDALAGAGALRSTAADMSKFIAAAAGASKTPLAAAFAESLKMQRQGQSKLSKIGLGWNNADLFGTEVFWHGGGTGGFSSYLAIDPKNKKGAFVVNNSGRENGAVFPESVAFNFLQSKFPVKTPRRVVVLSEEILEKYVGEYQLAPTFSITVTREGNRLFTQATGQEKFEIFAEKEDEFFVKEFEARISFTKDAGGKVSGAVLHQGGRDAPAKKVK